MNWLPGQPDDNGGDEDCAEKKSGASQLWNDGPCDRETVQRALCQTKK